MDADLEFRLHRMDKFITLSGDTAHGSSSDVDPQACQELPTMT